MLASDVADAPLLLLGASGEENGASCNAARCRTTRRPLVLQHSALSPAAAEGLLKA
jgi:hypothetical protein